MRGRTLSYAYIIVDEAQNTTRMQIEDDPDPAWRGLENGPSPAIPSQVRPAQSRPIAA
ncbi:MAG: PhoH family protein [Asticcacaulis sp.]